MQTFGLRRVQGPLIAVLEQQEYKPSKRKEDRLEYQNILRILLKLQTSRLRFRSQFSAVEVFVQTVGTQHQQEECHTGSAANDKQSDSNYSVGCVGKHDLKGVLNEEARESHSEPFRDETDQSQHPASPEKNPHA
jgi:hypothetical protein